MKFIFEYFFSFFFSINLIYDQLRLSKIYYQTWIFSNRIIRGKIDNISASGTLLQCADFTFRHLDRDAPQEFQVFV